jgi:hypothetical protein
MTREEIRRGYIDARCPGITGYAYQATTWCVDCGRAIARRLVRDWERSGKLGEITHLDLGNTEQFPVPIVFEPTDYCDQCGSLNDDN